MRKFALVTVTLLAAATMLSAQSLPVLHSANPVAESRSGLYFQPLVPAGPGWRPAIGLDYSSMVEINFRGTTADTAYLLDAEVLRVNFTASRDLDPNTFVLGEAWVGGSYAGFLDGFLSWYHGIFGIRFPERDDRAKNRFQYRYEFPGGDTVYNHPTSAGIGDLRFGIGRRFGDKAQSVLSVTLPTSTLGDGFARRTVSVSLLNTVRLPVTPRLIYEGSANIGFTPRQGDLSAIQRNLFVLGTSGFRWRTFGGFWSFANLYLHSPYYEAADAFQLERSELTLDFGWMIRGKSGREFRFGMTEDLWPSGPGVDATFRLGYTF